MRQDLKVGDRIVLYHMEQERVPMGEKGTVISVNFDPFEEDNKIVGVKWDNGSTLSLLTKYDYWKVIQKAPLQESVVKNSGNDNSNFLKNFDIQAIHNYLKDLKDSGITNMYMASPYLYAGENWISEKHGFPYDNENMDEQSLEAYERVLANANTIKNKIIDGAYKNVQASGKDFDISDFNREMKRQAVRLLNHYMLFA